MKSEPNWTWMSLGGREDGVDTNAISGRIAELDLHGLNLYPNPFYLRTNLSAQGRYTDQEHFDIDIYASDLRILYDTIYERTDTMVLSAKRNVDKNVLLLNVVSDFAIYHNV